MGTPFSFLEDSKPIQISFLQLFKMKLVYLIFGTLCFQLSNVELEAAAIEDSIPFYRYYKSNGFDHFYTTNPKEIGTVEPGTVGKHDYKSEGIAGYCSREQLPRTIPLYRYWHEKNGDHFYTTDANEIGTTSPGQTGSHGYKSEGISCYVLPA